MPSPAPPRPSLSLVVPVYNVAGFVAECIESIQTQQVDDLEIVAVDDGSTDDSAAILADLANHDARLRIVTQDNQGLGAARNAGVDHATGEFLWFVDSDDRLAPGAIATMLATITKTGSDLVTGNVSRLIGETQSPTRFVAETFARTRLRTHIHRFPLLINDRVAWNKVYRRSFWDHHAFRFPSRVHYEDQYVTLPAHYLARQVDVRREPVYLWRVRDESDVASITQQRSDPQSMADRVAAVAYVSQFLADRGRRRDKLRYDESAVTHDLRYFLDVFDSADPAYRDAFLTATNRYLATVDNQAFARLPALRRLQWELVRRGDADRVAELVRFEREDLAGARARRSGRRWYAEYPGRSDPALELSSDRFVVDRELRLTSIVNSLEVDARSVRIRGRAAIDQVGDVERWARFVAIPQGRGRPLIFRATITAGGEYAAELPLTRVLPALKGGHHREWRLVLLASDHGLRRVAAWHELGAAERTAARVVASHRGGSEIRLALTGRGRLTLAASAHPITVRDLSVDSEVLEITATASTPLAATRLVITGSSELASLPVHVEPLGAGATYLARLPLRPLVASGGRIGLVVGGDFRGLAYDGDEVTTKVDEHVLQVGSDSDGYLAVLTDQRN
jgi:glycosyltransferase involved in cell wall biosynthesis